MGGFVIVVICILIAMIWGIYAGKKRKDDMGMLADRLGLRFQPERNYQIASQFAFLDKLNHGSNRYAYNRMSGMFADHAVEIFDYHYETHSRDSKGRRRTHHHHFSFFILQLERAFPELTIGREGFFSKLAQAVGFDDIDFESHEFSKRFAVRSKDKKFAYDFCNAQMIDYLLGMQQIELEVDAASMALSFNRCLKVEEIEVHLRQLVDIRKRMPDYLFERS
ncbi:MAG: hypothetical protein JXR25_12950 [Pontiellaceae bacterium]|nr:hypothetical protein [Pontiellaceae bacterium]MBN2785724.1 hypothetical protein [Pontiellaceae bacterium]